MDFDMPGADDPRRLAVRAWLSDHPHPSNADLHAAGYIAPHWPPPFGIDADPLHQLIIDDELRAGGVGRTSVTTNAIGVGWAAPTIYMAGSEWQQQRFLDPIFRGDEFWCQLFSEPDAGSDLAGLAKARRPRRRRVRRQRLEDLDQWRSPRPVRHPDRPH